MPPKSIKRDLLLLQIKPKSLESPRRCPVESPKNPNLERPRNKL